MKANGFLILVLLAGGGYLAYRHHTGIRGERDEMERRLMKLEQEMNEEARPRPGGMPHHIAAGAPKQALPDPHTERYREERVVCHACRGEGWIAHSDHRRARVGCPICNNLGYRIVSMPPGAQLCPQTGCRGMGKIPITGGPRLRSRGCRRCNGAGWIMSAQ